MVERSAMVNHATSNRWFVKLAPAIAIEALRVKFPTSPSWPMDETYVNLRGKWSYLFRAVDKRGKALDFMLPERRNTAAAIQFFTKAVFSNGISLRTLSDRLGAIHLI